MEVHETPLPGVGIRYDFTTTDGHQMAVLNHHSGRRELIVYDREDPDAGRDFVNLEDDEADTLASLLGAARFAGPLGELQQRVEGLAIDWIDLRPNSPFVDRELGDTAARTKTGVSIVAIMRGDHAFPSPKPDFRFAAKDVLVVVGTPDGIRGLSKILDG